MWCVLFHAFARLNPKRIVVKIIEDLIINCIILSMDIRSSLELNKKLIVIIDMMLLLRRRACLAAHERIAIEVTRRGKSKANIPDPSADVWIG